MKILGVRIPFTETKAAGTMQSVANRGWWRIHESFSGAWQRNITIDRDAILAHHAVFACMTLIASDISKLAVRLVEKDRYGIWNETESSAFSPVLKKPNRYQNRIQFWESWILSKLRHGNTYVLKEKDARGIVTALYVLDPLRVQVMVADDGSVYYRLSTDTLAGMPSDVMVPASEIIHDRFNCLFHPLVGLSPLYANALAAQSGVNAQNSSAHLFANNSQPGGILTAAGELDDDAQARLKTQWETAFAGDNAGRIAVLGEGLTYTQLAMSAKDTELVDQLKWSADIVCSTYHVPPYKIGVGEMPKYDNIQSLNIEYYSQCLQKLIEDAELCMDEGLGLSEKKEGRTFGVEFDIDNLLRMDSASLMKSLREGTGGGILKINEARKKANYGPVEGGDTPYLQEQNYSLAALAKRDAKEDPFAKSAGSEGTSVAAPADEEPAASNDNSAAAREALSFHRRAMLSSMVGLPSPPLQIEHRN